MVGLARHFFTGFFSGLVWVMGMSGAQAQAAREQVIDPALLSQSILKIDCNLMQYPAAHDCLSRLVPSLVRRTTHYAAMQSTFLLKVELGAFGSSGSMSSVGSAFLVDRDRGYFLTAKHVLLGDRIWSTVFPATHSFADLETAIEDHITSSGNVKITLQSSEDQARVSASLIALDRNTDLALIAVNDINAFAVANFPALFKPLQIAPARSDCPGSFAISAIGFSQSAQVGRMEINPTIGGYADCRLTPRTYVIGGQKYRVPLLSTAINFFPGFSGGPVLDEAYHVVGVVSGATVAGSNKPTYNFFVPVTAVHAFLNRFR